MSMGGRQLRPGLCIDSTADKTTMADRFSETTNEKPAKLGRRRYLWCGELSFDELKFALTTTKKIAADRVTSHPDPP